MRLGAPVPLEGPGRPTPGAYVLRGKTCPRDAAQKITESVKGENHCKLHIKMRLGAPVPLGGPGRPAPGACILRGKTWPLGKTPKNMKARLAIITVNYTSVESVFFRWNLRFSNGICDFPVEAAFFRRSLRFSGGVCDFPVESAIYEWDLRFSKSNTCRCHLYP